MKATAPRLKLSLPRRELSARWKAAAGSLRRHKNALERHIKKVRSEWRA